MEVIHRILGYLAVVVVVIGIVWSFVMTRRPLLGRTRFHRFQTLVVALVVVTGDTRLASGVPAARQERDGRYRCSPTALRPSRRGINGARWTGAGGQRRRDPARGDGATHHVRVIMGGSARSAQRDPGPAMPMLANDGAKKETDR